MTVTTDFAAACRAAASSAPPVSDAFKALASQIEQVHVARAKAFADGLWRSDVIACIVEPSTPLGRQFVYSCGLSLNNYFATKKANANVSVGLVLLVSVDAIASFLETEEHASYRDMAKDIVMPPFIGAAWCLVIDSDGKITLIQIPEKLPLQKEIVQLEQKARAAIAKRVCSRHGKGLMDLRFVHDGSRMHIQHTSCCDDFRQEVADVLGALQIEIPAETSA